MYERVTIEDDLYVMQNEHGLIKIGRSLNPEKRRRTLQLNEHCQIKLVFALHGEGHREESVHRRLKKFHIVGEWFDGTEAARAAIARNVKRNWNPAWPFEFDEAAGKEWLEQFFRWRQQRLNEKDFQRVFARVRAATEPGWSLDGDVWYLLSLSDTGAGTTIDVTRDQGEVILHGWAHGTVERVRIPNYSGDVGVAMTVWPAEIRPMVWGATALECCIAALWVRQTLLPRGWRKGAARLPRCAMTRPTNNFEL